MKKRLGLPTDLPAILLVGGGEGMGKLEITVDQIAEKLGGSCQIIVICGRNQKLLETLRAKRYASGMPVTVTGFIDNIHEYMHASDAIVTKAGPGTIAEALISGLPILLNGNVPCQVCIGSSGGKTVVHEIVIGTWIRLSTTTGTGIPLKHNNNNNCLFAGGG